MTCELKLCILAINSDYRFLGKFISQYISLYIQQGSKGKEVIFDGFDYERWKKTYLKSHSEQVQLPTHAWNFVKFIHLATRKANLSKSSCRVFGWKYMEMVY